MEIEKIKLIQSSFLQLWQSYTTWFTWHFGIHIVAFGGVFSVEKLWPHIAVVALFMGFNALLGAGANIAMMFYHFQTQGLAKASWPEGASAVTGGALLNYAVVAMAAVNILILTAWAYLAINPAV